jgi:type VI secretion system protein ImpA
MAIDVEALCTPISTEHPGGAPANPQTVEKIRDARREDDATLPQGEWTTALRKADWPRVIELASAVLGDQCKDLQVAGWLAEGVVARHGFEGAADAFKLLTGLLERFWDDLYPPLEDGDLDPRAAKFEWFATNLATRIARVPLTQTSDAFGLSKWLEAKDTDRRISQKPENAEQLLADGRITGQMFDQAVDQSSNDFVVKLMQDIGASQEALQALEKGLGNRFGNQAPSMGELESTLQQCAEVAKRAAEKKGLLRTASGNGAGDPQSSAQAAGRLPGPAAAGIPGSRQSALAHLLEIAEFFRKTEPHSPVAFLIQQAVRWAETPLDKWLAEVIKDEGSLSRVREMLGIRMDAPS